MSWPTETLQDSVLDEKKSSGHECDDEYNINKKNTIFICTCFYCLSFTVNKKLKTQNDTEKICMASVSSVQGTEVLFGVGLVWVFCLHSISF